MKNIYVIILFVSLASFSQEFECGVPNVSQIEDEIHRQQTVARLRSANSVLTDGEVAYVPIKVHLIGEDNDTGYLDSGTVNKALARLNNEFDAINIQFYFSGTQFNQYPNSELYNGAPDFFDNLAFHDVNGANNAINLYFANAVIVNGSSVGGISPVSPTDQSLNRIFYRNASVMNGKSFVHEFGHFFGCLHTFNNSTSPSVFNRELVTRNFDEEFPRLSANCNSKGDFLCDTPADPYGNPDTDMNFCVYSGSLTDANGDTYSPDLTNYLAYNTCVPYTFTEGQYQRMQDGLLILTNPTNTFTLDAPETVQNAPSNLMAMADAYGVTLTWTDNSGVETGYLIERAPSVDGPFKVVAGTAENETSLEHVTAVSGEPNFYRIKPSNSKNIYSAVSEAVMSNFYCANYSAQSCNMPPPQFPALVIDDFILVRNGESVIENFNSGCSVGATADYYNAFSSSAAAGDTLEFLVSSRAGTLGGVYAVVVALYADWNQDFDFDDDGELLFTSEAEALSVTGNFQIPTDIVPGNYRLRVVLTNTVNLPEPCYVFSGEIEDYKLTVNSLGISELKSQNLVIAPNPATHTLEIQSDTIPEKLVITDMTGKIVLTQLTDTKKANIGMLASGMYILQAFSADRKFQAKFVKL